MIGLCALPASAAPATPHSASHSFTIPSASSAVKAWGSYTIINSVRIKVSICVKQTGSAASVEGEATAYGANGKQEGLPFGATILPQSPRQECNTTYLLFVKHLKVHTAIRNANGKVIKASKVKTLF